MSREKINAILSDWNPIGVPEHIASEEYKSYLSIIEKAAVNEESLFNCLETILVEKMGLEFDRTNNDHVTELHKVCKEILRVKEIV